MSNKRLNELLTELDAGRTRSSILVETAGVLLIIAGAFTFFLVP